MYKDNAEAVARAAAAWCEPEHGRILEIGCGDGRVTKELARRVSRLYGLDPDFGCLRSTSQCGAFGVLAAEGGRLPFPDETFDRVVFTLSLHHQEPAPALAECARVLPPDGKAVVVEPDTDGELERMCYFYNDEAGDLIRARAAIERSSLIETRRFLLKTRWTFDRPEALKQWLDDLYEPQDSAEKWGRVREFLGPRAADCPLVLRDDLWLFQLEKADMR